MNKQNNDTSDSKILKKRAGLLAKEKSDSFRNESGLEILFFQIGEEQYGVETNFVKKVYPLKDLTPLPGLPLFIVGIVNIRGQVLPVLDLKKFFDLSGEEPSEKHKIIILSTNESVFGILSEEVHGLRFIPDKEMQDSLPTLTGVRSDYLKCITNDQAIILDILKLTSSKRILIEDKI